jgi:hypothetical protein
MHQHPHDKTLRRRWDSYPGFADGTPATLSSAVRGSRLVANRYGHAWSGGSASWIANATSLLGLNQHVPTEQRSHPVGLPSDMTLPFFAYGLLKTDELAFDQIRQYVTQAHPAALLGAALRTRDGLPLLDPGAHGERVSGDVLSFVTPREAYQRIGEFEPDKLYRWDEPRSVEVDGRNVRVNVLVGVSPAQGSEQADLSSWSSAQDPVVLWGLPTVRRLSLQCALDKFEPTSPDHMTEWAPRFFEVQSVFLLATAILERLSTFACGARLNATDRVLTFGASPRFVAALDQITVSTRVVRRSDQPRTRSRGVVDAWYVVRSNLLHRGKSAFRDAELLRGCLIELHDALRIYLLDVRPELTAAWTNIEGPSEVQWRLAPGAQPT